VVEGGWVGELVGWWVWGRVGGLWVMGRGGGRLVGWVVRRLATWSCESQNRSQRKKNHRTTEQNEIPIKRQTLQNLQGLNRVSRTKV